MKVIVQEEVSTLSSKLIRDEVRRILEELEKEQYRSPYGGLRCPKCGGVMMHTRLHGYKCALGCD